jgi:hypothetical protein
MGLMVRLIRLNSVAVAILIGTALLLGCSETRDPPALMPDGSVADDLEALAQETWSRFLTAFEARADCFGDVRLRAVKDLESRAAYDPASATVSVRVPATAALLRGALVHEWAHHIEFQCDEHADLRAAFLAAQGLPSDTPWRPDLPPSMTPVSMWADIPSEQCAETVVTFVLGRRQIGTGVSVAPEAVTVVESWASGE